MSDNMLASPLFALGTIPPGPLMGMFLGAILLVLLAWGIRQPLAWLVVSFLAIGCGVGCAGYGLGRALIITGPHTNQDVEWISSMMGGGVGATTAGIVLLVVGLIRCRRKNLATKAA